MKIRKFLTFIAISIVLLFFVFAFPYIWVEINTLIFADDFGDCCQQIDVVGDKEYTCKVYYKTITKAKLLCITYEGVFMSYFEKQDNSSWKLVSYDILWSRYGNAFEFFYPFYRAKDWNIDLSY